jgi:hypothetical protein
VKRVASIGLNAVALAFAFWILWAKGIVIGPLIFLAIGSAAYLWLIFSRKKGEPLTSISFEDVFEKTGSIYGWIIVGMATAFFPFLLIWCLGMFFFGWPPFSKILHP